MIPAVLRAILFDFNGVLVDDEPLHLELFQRVFAEEELELDEAEYYERYLGLDDRGVFTAVLAAGGETATPVRLSRLIARKAAYYRDRVHHQGYPFFPGAREVIEEAARGGLAMGVVSGALREEIEGALRQLGCRHRFKVVVAAEDVREAKPDPEGYRRGLELLNSLPPLPERLLHPHEVLAIEDSAAGLAAAAGAGLSTLGVAHTYPRERLRDADRLVDRLEDLTLERLHGLFTAVG